LRISRPIQPLAHFIDRSIDRSQFFFRFVEFGSHAVYLFLLLGVGLDQPSIFGLVFGNLVDVASERAMAMMIRSFGQQ
jgi:hypothetical protein